MRTQWTGCEKPVVLLQEPCVSCVWAQGWPISGTWGPPRLPPPVQVHTGHSHLRMLSWTCASPSPTPVQENSLQGRADSSGQGSSMYQKCFFFSFDGFTKVFQKLQQLSPPQLTWKASLTGTTALFGFLYWHFSISILKNGCPLHSVFLTWQEKDTFF